MKTNRILNALIIPLFAFGSVYAAEDKKLEDGAHKHETGASHDHNQRVEVAIPATVDALWSEIDSRQKILRELLIVKKSDDLHTAAETVEALVGAVPSKYADLAMDKKKRIEGQAKNVARILDQMHEEAEKGHWDDAQKSFLKMEAALKIIMTQVEK